jgi:hypothetical protein
VLLDQLIRQVRRWTAFEERRYTVVGGRADVGPFLADLVAVVSSVLACSVTGLRWPPGSGY